MTFLKHYLTSVFNKPQPEWLNWPLTLAALGIALLGITAGSMLVAAAIAIGHSPVPLWFALAILAMGATGLGLLRLYPAQLKAQTGRKV